MRQRSGTAKPIRIVLEGLRGEESIAELCRREGIAMNLYYSWSKEFLEAGKRRLAGDTAREATSPEVKGLRAEAAALKEAVAELLPRELAVRFTDTRRHFVSETSVYRILKAHDLVTSPAFALISVADEFHEKTTRPNQLWQTDFTYLKVIGCLLPNRPRRGYRVRGAPARPEGLARAARCRARHFQGGGPRCLSICAGTWSGCRPGTARGSPPS